MFAKRPLRQFALALLFLLAAVALVSCQAEEKSEGQPDPSLLYGNGFLDQSTVICKIDDFEITRNMLDLRYEEMPRRMKSRFSGEDWDKRFLRFMVDEILMVQEAVRRKLYLDPEVAQHLISQRRSVLKSALAEIDLIKDAAPTEEQIRVHFERNRESYLREGTGRARHIPCQDKDAAWQAYDRLRQGGRAGAFPLVVAEFSTNLESAKQAGELGWFNRGGFIPAIPYGKEFSEAVWEWEVGLHEPALIGGEWQVVEIVGREYERSLTLEEARDRVVKELTPIVEEEIVEAFLREAKQAAHIEFFGSFRPGQGRTPKELFERAWYAPTPEQKIDLYKIVIEDFPQSDLADDALLMIANVYLDTWGDIPFAGRYLDRLIRNYPDSELFDDAQYMLENMGSADFVSPTSIEDLRRGARNR